MNAVLGVDLASASWKANGSALVAWGEAAGGRTVTRVEPACIAWRVHAALTPGAMADAIDACARRHGVRAVAIDGPHAWRDPGRGADGPGVGRWSEYLVRAQGKTGVRGQTYPRTQLGWTSFSIAVFDALLARPEVRLAEPIETSRVGGIAGAGEGAESGEAAYLVLETYPTATWRAAALAPLPAKARRPDVAGWYARLAETFDLPRDAEVRGHDDLQAVVAALGAVGVAGGPLRAGWHGHPCRVVDGVRVEGGIWVATT